MAVTSIDSFHRQLQTRGLASTRCERSQRNHDRGVPETGGSWTGGASADPGLRSTTAGAGNGIGTMATF
jgi:hypothetical protein